MTRDDLLDALRDAMSKPPTGEDGFTVEDIRPLLGCAKEKARVLMATLLRAGEIEMVPVRRQRYDGIWVTQRGFRRREPSA